MTISEIIASEKLFLTPTDVSPVIGVDAQSIRDQAHKDPFMLGFPVVVVGTRTRIPRIPFLHYIGFGGEQA